jgi:hypothetical protein
MPKMVQVAIGKCPLCDAETECCDGLEHYLCGRGHAPTHYVLMDAYYEDAARTWKD